MVNVAGDVADILKLAKYFRLANNSLGPSDTVVLWVVSIGAWQPSMNEGPKRLQNAPW